MRKLIYIFFLTVLAGVTEVSYITQARGLEEKQREAKAMLIRDSLIREVDRYIHIKSPEASVHADVLVDLCLQYDMDVCFVLAQAQAESHFGTRGMASKTNSIFNVCAYDWTNANAMRSKGHGYNHPDDSIEPYILLLKNQYLTDGKTTDDLLKNYVNSNGKRYASLPTYEKQLSSIRNKIVQTTSIKTLNDQYKWTKLKS